MEADGVGLTWYLIPPEEVAARLEKWREENPDGVLGLDVETTGLDPHTSCIRLAQISTGEKTYIVDVFKHPDLSPIEEFLGSGPVKVIHNAKFEIKFFLNGHGISVYPVFDTMMAAQIARSGSASLSDLVTEFLDEDMTKEQQASDWSAEELSTEQLDYAARDAAVLPRLREAVLVDMDEGMRHAAELEFRTVEAVAAMELNGILLDPTARAELAEITRERRDAAVISFEDAIPVDTAAPVQGALDFGLERAPTTNLNSPKQVMPALARAGVHVSGTAVGVIGGIDHPAVHALLDYRKHQKRLSSYLESWPNHINPQTGRIHANFLQTFVVTGRMNCSSPNLQNVPKEQEFRSLFVAENGSKMIGADYSQIELRILAEVAGDRKLIELFQSGADLHRETAATMFKIPVENVTSEQRGAGKTMNFGLVYGRGANSVAGDLNISKRQAGKLIEAYFARFPNVQSWIEKQRSKGRDTKHKGVRTLSGRFARLPYDNDTGERERVAVNYVVQGSSGDITKEALARLRHTLPEGARLVNVIHDEILVEAKDEVVHEAVNIVEREMIAAGEAYLKEVPIEVDHNVGRCWEK